MSKSIPSPFEVSNTYYDLLYAEKDYAGEAGYVTKIIATLKPGAKEIVELGCGTGNYSEHFCTRGFKVTGIEQSAGMVDVAQSKSIEGFLPLVESIATFNLPKKFDVAVSLFHVISYLTTNADIVSCFKQVSNHLNKDGIFIFDVWYTPAVYSQKPETRIKRVENEDIKITRIAESTLLYQQNTVNVNYEIIILSKADNQSQLLKESHLMRHFSTPEIKLFAELAGFTMIQSEEFLTANEPGASTWGVCYVLQKHD
jgi:SAM-dependent methyltransferase